MHGARRILVWGPPVLQCRCGHPLGLHGVHRWDGVGMEKGGLLVWGWMGWGVWGLRRLIRKGGLEELPHWAAWSAFSRLRGAFQDWRHSGHDEELRD